MDLAVGHVKALIYQKISNPVGFKAINLGTGKGYSVLEVIHAFEKASGKTIPYKIVGRRAGDISASYADASLANKELDWQATKDIDDMCKLLAENYHFYINYITIYYFLTCYYIGIDTWKWQQNNPNGYKS
ncbi:UDP-glucose 4-epimerase [Anthophora plagiata]